MAAFKRQLQRNSKLDIFYISYCDIKLKRNKFYGFLLGKGFRKKCNHTGLALNFIQKQ